MQTLPQPADSVGEARPVSEILSRADPADMPAMRAGLSFLTSAGAELATALDKSNQENQRLMGIISALPPEWVEAATTGAAFPDISSLRAEVEVLKDERIDLRGQLVERDQSIQALNEQIAQIEAEQATRLDAEALAQTEAQPSDEALAARLEELQAELDDLALARAEAEDHLRASEADLSDIDNHLASLRGDLLTALPEDQQAELAAAPDEDQVQDERQRRAMRLGALAAAISAVVDHGKQSDALLAESNATGAAAQEQLEIVSSAKVALEADLQEKVTTLDDLQAQLEHLNAQSQDLAGQIEQLNGQNAALQGDLETALAAKAQLEEQLLAREGELAELNQQIDSVAQQLRLVLPEDTLAQLVPAEEPGEEVPLSEEGEAAAPSEEGEVAKPRSASPKMLGLGAIAAGVAAAVDLSQQKGSEAEQASGQLASVVDEKTSLETALQEKEQAIAELNAQIEALNAQSTDVQAQLAAALAVSADLEQQAGERDGLLSDLQSQMQDAVSRLQEIVPAEDLPQPEALEDEGEPAEVEGDAGAGEAGAVKAVGLATLVTGAAALVDRNTSSLVELQAQLDGLREEKAGLEAVLGEKTQELAGYNDYSLNLQGQVNALAAERSALEADLQMRMASQAEVEAQVASLTAQVQALTDQVDGLQAELDAANAAKAEVEQALQASQAQLGAAQADLAAIEAEAEQTMGDGVRGLGAVAAGAAAVASIKEKDTALAAADERVATLQGQLDALEAERADLALSKEELQASLQSREAELADLTGQLEALQLQVTGIAGERGALQGQLLEMEEALSESEAQRSAKAPLALAAALTETLANKPAYKSSCGFCGHRGRRRSGALLGRAGADRRQGDRLVLPTAPVQRQRRHVLGAGQLAPRRHAAHLAGPSAATHAASIWSRPGSTLISGLRRRTRSVCCGTATTWTTSSRCPASAKPSKSACTRPASPRMSNWQPAVCSGWPRSCVRQPCKRCPMTGGSSRPTNSWRRGVPTKRSCQTSRWMLPNRRRGAAAAGT